MIRNILYYFLLVLSVVSPIDSYAGKDIMFNYSSKDLNKKSYKDCYFDSKNGYICEGSSLFNKKLSDCLNGNDLSKKCF